MLDILEKYSKEQIYVAISWPDSQDFMDKEWFSSEAEASSTDAGTYLIPLYRLISPS